jgi:hypothetical protein
MVSVMPQTTLEYWSVNLNQFEAKKNPARLDTQGFSIRDEFDINNPDNLGRPYFFDLKMFIATVEMFICSDEIETALWLLDNPPAWYREHYPPELMEIKKTLFGQTYDQHEYATDDDEANCQREFGESQWLTGYTYPRAEIIMKEIKELNAKGLSPWIFDLGCSHGNLPLGLMKEKMSFKYCGTAMNYRIEERVKEWVGALWQEECGASRPTILWCTEVLEHCFDPNSLVHSAYKKNVEFDQIILSTPLGCLHHGLPNWRTRRIGHVRGWTPNEFGEWAMKNWPGYKWELHKSFSMVLHGRKS